MNTDTSRNFEIWVEKKCESSWKKVWVELKKNESRVEKKKLSRERENADQWYCQSMFSRRKPVPGSQIVGMTRQCVSVLSQFREPDYLRAWNRLSLHRDEAYIQSSGSLAARCCRFFFLLARLIDDSDRQLSAASYDSSEFLFRRLGEYESTLATLSSKCFGIYCCNLTGTHRFNHQ